MLMMSCSTSSSLLLRRGLRCKDGWVLGKGTGLNVGLEVSLSISSELWSLKSEPFKAETGTAEMRGLHCSSISAGTGWRVTRIWIESYYLYHLLNHIIKLTKKKYAIRDANLGLSEPTSINDIGTSGQLVIRVDSKVPARSFQANQPRGSGRVIWFRFTKPVKELRKKNPELFINSWISIIWLEFKPRTLHYAKAWLLHPSESDGRDVDIRLQTINRIKLSSLGPLHSTILDN